MRPLNVIVVFGLFLPQSTSAAEPGRSSLVTVQAHRFTGGSEREDSMWSALYAAKSGKLYIGLSTHAEAAHFFELDPESNSMSHIADMTQVKGERGQGIRTTGKIHVRMGEDAQGRIYFGDFCEDTGPECVDPASYRGPHCSVTIRHSGNWRISARSIASGVYSASCWNRSINASMDWPRTATSIRSIYNARSRSTSDG